MLYNDLIRLNSIDQDIIRQLKRLSALYEERALIMNLPGSTVADKVATSLEERYEILGKRWASIGVEVPPFAVLKAKLAKAVDIMASHQDTMTPGMDIVLVPPTKVLLTAMQHAPAPAVDIQSYKDLKVKPTYAWHCAVVKNAGSRQAVEDVRLFIHNQPLDRGSFSKLETGANVVTAAYLQGINLVEKGTWNLLIGDMASVHEVPCARLVDDRLSFSFDDSAGFLGQNYYYPSVTIKAGK